MAEEQAEDGGALENVTTEHPAGLAHQAVQPLQRQLLIQSRRALLAAGQKVDRSPHAQGHSGLAAGGAQGMGEALLFREGHAGQQHLPVRARGLVDSGEPGRTPRRQTRR